VTHRSALTVQRSIELLAGAQTPQGAIPASTAHQTYQFGWLRDGCWCAYALDRAGRSLAAAAWHHWVAATLLRHAHRVEQALAAIRRGTVNPAVMLPARFTLTGQEETRGGEAWPNFQTDCYGLWLWALADHVRRGGHLDPTLEQAARLVVRYLLGAGQLPCFDCWEEHPGNLHTASLAAVSAGLRDAGALLGDIAAHAYAEHLRRRLLGPEHTLAGGFIRCPGDTRVDGSLLWLGVPFGVVAVDDDRYTTTVSRIREELYRPGGGVRRYQGDSFYGGGQWILLAASLGWATLATGATELAPQLLAWIEASANDAGYLPEQVTDQVQSPHMLAWWQARWGSTVIPLLWSHAMHVILCDQLQAGS
jgi:isomaltose glucohydrolase